jgi:hypothetical protein
VPAAATIGPVTSPTRWAGASGSALTRTDGERRLPELVTLGAGLPSVADLFTFMRDAELRFDTLRMRIEERTITAEDEQVVESEVLVRHPRDAKVTTTKPDAGVAGDYEIWISDGETVRTFSSVHRLGTQRPVREAVRGLHDRAFPPASKVYSPLTTLPMETLPDTFVHPAGYCQNVLATGDCRVVGTAITTGATMATGREAIILDCSHPRTVELAADRPDFRIRIAVDRLDGVILRLEEWISEVPTRNAEVLVYEPNAPLPPSAFDFRFPTDTTMLF